MRFDRLTCGCAVAVLCLCPAGCGSTASATSKQVIVLGIDGMDPGFVEKHWKDLPNLARLKDDGEFRRLETVMPPQSPVAWSTFITGMDSGGHGIFDFIHRDPRTLAPYSSIAASSDSSVTIPVGAYELPLTSGKVTSLRKGTPFWSVLAEHHIPVTVIRMPTDFPPVHCDDGFSVAGMGMPDLGGALGGTFSYFTDSPTDTSRSVAGGRIEHVDLRDHQATLRIFGPGNALRKDKAPTFVEMKIAVDPDRPAARFAVEDREFVLNQGEWSPWIEVEFPMIPVLKNAAGMFRVYAKQLHPNLEIYVSPVNVDPSDPELPVTAPESYGRELAKNVGLFYTQGMAQDTAAYRSGVFDKDDYIAQSRLVSEDHLKLLRYAVRHFSSGFLFFHFFGIDQDSHMLWGKYDDDVLRTYELVDQTVGWVREQLPRAELMIMSDHGFATFERALNVNTWLMQNGFLTLDDPSNTSDEEVFPHVDWSRTKAYAMGLNGIYLNLHGRERQGIVSPGEEAAAVMKSIVEKLENSRDPANGKPMVASVEIARDIYHGAMAGSGPDLEVGYMPGYRASWQTALGAVPTTMVDDNTDAWRADHCIDPRFVPGVLISNRKSRAADPHLYDLTVSLLHEFGVAPLAGMIGHSIY